MFCEKIFKSLKSKPICKSFFVSFESSQVIGFVVTPPLNQFSKLSCHGYLLNLTVFHVTNPPVSSGEFIGLIFLNSSSNTLIPTR